MPDMTPQESFASVAARLEAASADPDPEVERENAEMHARIGLAALETKRRKREERDATYKRESAEVWVQLCRVALDLALRGDVTMLRDALDRNMGKAVARTELVDTRDEDADALGDMTPEERRALMRRLNLEPERLGDETGAGEAPADEAPADGTGEGEAAES